MKMKLLGTSVAAALLALSTGVFAQAGGGGGGGSAAGSAAVGSPVTGDEKGSIKDGSTGTSVNRSRDNLSTTHCDALSGAEKTRCMRDARAASTGSSRGTGTPADPVTPAPKAQGDGAGSGK